jgi:hypothetical protein
MECMGVVMGTNLDRRLMWAKKRTVVMDMPIGQGEEVLRA